MRRNPYRFILSLAAVLFAVAWAYWSNLPSSQKTPDALKNIFSHEVFVRQVIDGDTVELSNGQRVRYLGIDCPESRKKTSAGWVEVNQPFSKEATRFNEALVFNKKVRLDFDVENRDKYKRLLAYCFVKQGEKEVLVQAELLRNGFAYLYTAPPNVKYVNALVEALQEAKQKKLGVWSLDLSIVSTQAAHFLGERKMVEGVISRVRQSDRVVHLLMEGLEVVVFKKDFLMFLNKGIDPVKFYNGKKVRVFGLIKEYNGQTEIILSNPWQIEILE